MRLAHGDTLGDRSLDQVVLDEGVDDHRCLARPPSVDRRLAHAGSLGDGLDRQLLDRRCRQELDSWPRESPSARLASRRHDLNNTKRCGRHMPTKFDTIRLVYIERRLDEARSNVERHGPDGPVPRHGRGTSRGGPSGRPRDRRGRAAAAAGSDDRGGTTAERGLVPARACPRRSRSATTVPRRGTARPTTSAGEDASIRSTTSAGSPRSIRRSSATR